MKFIEVNGYDIRIDTISAVGMVKEIFTGNANVISYSYGFVIYIPTHKIESLFDSEKEAIEGRLNFLEILENE